MGVASGGIMMSFRLENFVGALAGVGQSGNACETLRGRGERAVVILFGFFRCLEQVYQTNPPNSLAFSVQKEVQKD